MISQVGDWRNACSPAHYFKLPQDFMTLHSVSVSDDRIVSKLFVYNDFSRALWETRIQRYVTFLIRINQEKYVFTYRAVRVYELFTGVSRTCQKPFDLIWMDLQNLLIDGFFQFAKMIKPFFKLF